MKIDLTVDDAYILLDILCIHNACSSHCLMNYKTDLCDVDGPDGTPRCELNRTIDKIEKQICSAIHKDKRIKIKYCPVCGKEKENE